MTSTYKSFCSLAGLELIVTETFTLLGSTCAEPFKWYNSDIGWIHQGFEKSDNGVNVKIYNYDREGNYELKQVSLVKKKDEAGSLDGVVLFKSMHQLQNLYFALTGQN